MKRLLDSCILIDHFNGLTQAAIALHYNLKLVTYNTKDFDSNQHPFIEIPYKL